MRSPRGRSSPWSYVLSAGAYREPAFFCMIAHPRLRIGLFWNQGKRALSTKSPNGGDHESEGDLHPSYRNLPSDSTLPDSAGGGRPLPERDLRPVPVSGEEYAQAVLSALRSRASARGAGV